MAAKIHEKYLSLKIYPSLYGYNVNLPEVFIIKDMEINVCNMVKEILFKKNETSDMVKSCQRLIAWLGELDSSAGISYRQMSSVISSIMSCESVFAYLYTEEYKYGNIADVIDTRSEDFAKYTLAASLVFSEPNGLAKSIRKLPSLWENITSVLE